MLYCNASRREGFLVQQRDGNVADRTFQYRGDLRTTALPEMLYTIYRARVAGVVEAQRSGASKKVWIKDGSVVHASSSDRNDSLGVFLRRAGRISQDDFAATMRQREGSEQRLGELLIERGLLSPAAVYGAIREQVEAVVWSLFSWEDGEVTFSLGEANSSDSV